MSRYRTRLIAPPDEPLGTVRGLATLTRNPVEWWPASMYDEGVHAVRLLGRTFLHVARPELARTVLLDEADAFARSFIAQAALAPAMGGGLLTSDGPSWRRQRRQLAPLFRRDAIDGYLPAFDAAARACAARLARLDGRTAPVLPEMTRTTLDIILATVFGDPPVERAALARDVSSYLASTGHPDPFDILGLPPVIPRPWKWRGRRAVVRLRERSRAILAGSNTALPDAGRPDTGGPDIGSPNATGSLGTGRRDDGRRDAGRPAADSLIARLLAAVDPDTGERLDEDRVLDNILTFVGAGHETTAVALCWTLYLIAAQPSLQDALADEADAVLGSGPVTRGTFDALALHRRVAEESMRLYPPVPGVLRSVVREVTVGGRRLVPGDHVTVAILPMHRNAALWSDPHAFDDARFLPAAASARDRFAWLPFGGGPRVCIAHAFAMAETVTVLARLVAACRFEPADAPPPLPLLRVTLRPADGLPLRVGARGR